MATSVNNQPNVEDHLVENRLIQIRDAAEHIISLETRLQEIPDTLEFQERNGQKMRRMIEEELRATEKHLRVSHKVYLRI